MTRLSRLIALAALASATSSAQPALSEPPSAEDVLLGDISQSATADLNSEARISQSGQSNVTIISQRQYAEGLSSISVEQTGTDNLLAVFQSGSDNVVAAEQAGNGNLAVSQQLGVENVLISRQRGDNLGVIVRQYGGSAISVTQTGN